MLKKIRTDQLRTGMHIHELCGSWLEHPFWSKSFAIANDRDLERIRTSSVREAWIDTSRGLDLAADDGDDSETEDAIQERVDAYIAQTARTDPVPSAASPESAPVSPAPTAQVSLSEELARATRICAESRTAVTEMFREARLGRAIDRGRADALVEEISSSVLRNPAALISVARLKTADDYTYMHSVAVCALMIALGRKLGLSEADLRQAGMAGLLHDVGKMMIPLAVLNKPGKLTEAEFELVRAHPARGHRMLKLGGGSGDVVLDVCLHHHEKMDGSGYPEGLSGDRISLFAKMGAVCDVYDAITSDRPYKRGWDPSDSLRRMTEWKNGHFDDAVFAAFVKSLGIYPTGSLVRLQSGRLAVILEQAPGSLLTPRVKAFYSTESKSRIGPEIVELSAGTDRIVSREDPNAWNFPDLATLWK